MGFFPKLFVFLSVYLNIVIYFVVKECVFSEFSRKFHIRCCDSAFALFL